MMRKGKKDSAIGASTEEMGEGADTVGVVSRTARFTTAVHGEDGISHVHAANG